MKTLDDKDFDRTRGIVVIDEPVVGLDNNSLSHAFNFLKERAENVGQLFILTCRLQFFQRLKKWFGTGTEASYYMLDCVYHNGERSSVLAPLDKLLEMM